MERVWSLVMDRGDVSLTPKALLALGAMAKRVRPSHPDLTTQIVTDLHHLLEEHTGIAVLEKTLSTHEYFANLSTGHPVPHTLHKYKRSAIGALPSSLPHSSLHALLLDCLANAGAEESFPTLQQHTTFGPLSVQHAAVKSMGNYDTDEVFDHLHSPVT